MKNTIYKSCDYLSEEKSQTLQKLTEKLLKFCRENKVDRLNVNYMSEDCSPEEKDKRYGNYINLWVTDKKGNNLYSICEWEKRK